MGLFWDLMQQSQLSKHHQRASTLEGRVARLELELEQTNALLRRLIETLEQNVGRDIDGDGKIG